MDCSIVVCTRDNCASLQRTLSGLSEQRFDAGQLDIIVVDNASSDATESVVRAAAARSPVPIRYVLGPEVGLSFARILGIEQAPGEIVCFIDDDAAPRNSDWAIGLARAYDDPAVAAVGGDADPVWPGGSAPTWIPRLLWYNLGITGFDRRATRLCRYPNYPFGVNLSFRKALAVEVGGFSTHLGRVGGELRSGEEQELCLRLQKAGYKIVYLPGVEVQHFLSPRRLSREWFEERSSWEGKGRARIEHAHMSGARLSLRVLRHLGIQVVGYLGSLLFSRLGTLRLETLCRCEYLLARNYLSQWADLGSRQP